MMPRFIASMAFQTRQGARQHGFSLVELMIGMTISLFLMSALVGIFVNSSNSTRELAKANAMIDNGRLAIQLLQSDIEHAGYWGGYIPQWDDLTSSVVPTDTPTAVPNPCQAYASWDSNYLVSLIGIPIQTDDTLPVGAGCIAPATQHAGTDVLVVRHAEVCVPGAANCNADVAGALNFQTSLCSAEQNAGNVQMTANAATNTVTLSSSASSVSGAYIGLMLHTTSGTGAGQFRQISAYNGATKVAAVTTPWTIGLDATTAYAFPYALATSSYPLHIRNCVGTGNPPTLPITGGTIADKRKFVSNLYYIADYPDPENATQIVPTLVRSQFDLVSGGLAHQAPVPLIDGVEAFKVVLGIDNVSKSGAAVDYSQAIAWADPNNLVLPTNRGDGAPDQYVRCTTAAPCSVSQLMNVVAAKIYILMRNREMTRGFSDTKTYCLGEPNPDGTCPTANRYTPNDNYKRHMFVTSVRIVNVSARRETPP
jgi:prepilin-type N-terminal cleavage/methylation domain-containing protein